MSIIIKESIKGIQENQILLNFHEEQKPERSELDPPIRVLKSRKRTYDIFKLRANKRQCLSRNIEIPDGLAETEMVPDCWSEMQGGPSHHNAVGAPHGEQTNTRARVF
jgi:hypothetical protein